MNTDVSKKHAARNLRTEMIRLRMQLHIQGDAKLTYTRDKNVKRGVPSDFLVTVCSQHEKESG